MTNPASPHPPSRAETRAAARLVRTSALRRLVLDTVRPRGVSGVFRTHLPLALQLRLAAQQNRLLWWSPELFAVLAPPAAHPQHTGSWWLRWLDRWWDLVMFFLPPVLLVAAGGASALIWAQPATRREIWRAAALVCVLAAMVYVAALMIVLTVRGFRELYRMLILGRTKEATEAGVGQVLATRWSMPLCHAPGAASIPLLLAAVRTHIATIPSPPAISSPPTTPSPLTTSSPPTTSSPTATPAPTATPSPPATPANPATPAPTATSSPPASTRFPSSTASPSATTQSPPAAASPSANAAVTGVAAPSARGASQGAVVASAGDDDAGTTTDDVLCPAAGITSVEAREALRRQPHVGVFTADPYVLIIRSDPDEPLTMPAVPANITGSPLHGIPLLLTGMAAIVLVGAGGVAEWERDACARIPEPQRAAACEERPLTYGDALYWLLNRLSGGDPEGLGAHTFQARSLGLMITLMSLVIVGWVITTLFQQAAARSRRFGQDVVDAYNDSTPTNPTPTNPASTGPTSVNSPSVGSPSVNSPSVGSTSAGPTSAESGSTGSASADPDPADANDAEPSSTGLSLTDPTPALAGSPPAGRSSAGCESAEPEPSPAGTDSEVRASATSGMTLAALGLALGVALGAVLARRRR